MKKLEKMGADLGKLCQEKNEAYGDSFAQSHKILAALYPDGVRVDQYPDMLGIIRVIDKLFRLATKKGAFGESPWRDIGGYGILGAVADEFLGADNTSDEEGQDIAEKFNEEVATLGPRAIGDWEAAHHYHPLGAHTEGRACTNCIFSDRLPWDMPCKKCFPLGNLMPHWKSK